MTDVRGFCPMGCGETLFLGSGGYVTCSLIGCPRPDAASILLDSRSPGRYRMRWDGERWTWQPIDTEAT